MADTTRRDFLTTSAAAVAAAAAAGRALGQTAQQATLPAGAFKEPPERIPIAVRQIRSFLRAHRPAAS
jgi:hypothetical protein